MTNLRETDDHAPGMDRRALLGALAASGTLLSMGAARAEEEHKHHHDAHGDHSGHGDAAVHQALVSSALECVKRGEVCISHCISSLGQGDTSLKACLQSVLAMMPSCQALARLAALDAPRLKEFAKVCGDICADCQTECKKHQDHHAACKACGEACGECVEECRKII